MYTTAGIDAVATITELRSNTTDLLDHVRDSRGSLLIQKNNVPYAVLLDWETYNQLMSKRQETGSAEDRGPEPRHRRGKTASGKKTGSS